MITELRVRDLVTIADVTLQLGPGLNVLTGETGAGKSMVIDALMLLLGGRADADAIRPGASKAVIEAVFEPASGKRIRHLLESLGLDAGDDRLVVRREVSVEGRSRAWVNGSPTTIGALEQLGAGLADLHGQHQTVSLLKPEVQTALLDGYAGAGGEAHAVKSAWAEVGALHKQESDLGQRRDEVRRKADYLRHVVSEIDAARLVPGEDSKLDYEIRRLANSEEIRSLAERVRQAIDSDRGGSLPALHQAERALQQLERLDPAVGGWRTLVDNAYAALDELARAARDYAERLEQDPGRLAELEARRSAVDKLEQKYGATVEAVLETRAASGRELDLVDSAEFDLKSLAVRRSAAEQALLTAADALADRRRVGAERLARAVNRLLPKLGLQAGRFSVEFGSVEPIGEHGAEVPSFIVQLNQGLEPGPLDRVASGGELSRLMLALTLALAREDGVPTLVFDEIDQGVGGEVAGRLGASLSEVGAKHQVLVVTHLPQIAAKADRHLLVAKRTQGGIATSDVTVVLGEDRIIEIARMLGDPDGETARKHATTLLLRG